MNTPRDIPVVDADALERRLAELRRPPPYLMLSPARRPRADPVAALNRDFQTGRDTVSAVLASAGEGVPAGYVAEVFDGCDDGTPFQYRVFIQRL